MNKHIPIKHIQIEHILLLKPDYDKTLSQLSDDNSLSNFDLEFTLSFQPLQNSQK